MENDLAKMIEHVEKHKKIEYAYKLLSKAVINRAIKDSKNKNITIEKQSADYFLANVTDTIFWSIVTHNSNLE